MKKGDYWGTPQDLYDVLNNEYHFDIDVCANNENHKHERYFNEDMNALEQDWSFGSCWMNPPYSRGNITKFMKKAYEESRNGSIVVALVRFDPSAKWYQKWVHGKADEVRMLSRRVKFEGADSMYPFPCCVVVYHPEFDPEAESTIYSIWNWSE